MKFLSSNNRLVRGAEIVVLGGLALSLEFISYLVPTVLIIFGAYRLIRKSYSEGIVATALAIICWFSLQSKLGTTIINIIWIIGTALIITGGYLMITFRKNKIR